MHLTEDDLVLHYYGELASADEQRTGSHLAECQVCRREFTRLQRVLGTIDDSALSPELPDGFERTVWARLQPNLAAERRRGWFILSPIPLSLAAAVLLLVGAAFFAGRVSAPSSQAPVTASGTGEQVRERILLVDLSEHLDRSQMVLVEIVSGEAEEGSALDAGAERAEQLLAANRLYRHTAADSGDRGMSDLLDELERVLVELAANRGSSAPQLDGVRRQIEGQGLLFRMRVVSSELRERQKEAIQRRADQRPASGV